MSDQVTPEGAQTMTLRPESPLAPIKHALAAQRAPETDFRSAEIQRRGAEYREKVDGLFGDSADLLARFGVGEKQAREISTVLQNGEWLFDYRFLTNKDDVSIAFHEARPRSEERKRSGQELYGLEEVPTVEVQFKLSNMVEAAVDWVNTHPIPGREPLDPALVQQIMEGYAGLTRYKDFGLSLQFPVQEGEFPSPHDMHRFIQLNSQILRIYTGQDSALIMGGWTSSINFAQSEDPHPDSPKNEANLSQQYLARKRAEGKDAFTVACAGPGMENNEFTDKVDRQHPFGPRDHMMGAAAAHTLLGRGDGTAPRNLTLVGHSMSGAGAAAVAADFNPKKNVHMNILVCDPAHDEANPWTKWNDQARVSIPQRALSVAVAGGIDSVKRMFSDIPGYDFLEDKIATTATGRIFLPGDLDGMKPLIKKHVQNFREYSDRSSLTALGSVYDIPLDPDRLAAVMRDTGNPMKFVFVTDHDDKMVDAVSNLQKLPVNVPLFVLDDHDKGSHYSFKRNSRALRLGLLQQTMEQLDKPQFSHLHQELFMRVYDRKPGSAREIGNLLLEPQQAEQLETLFKLAPGELKTYLDRRSRMEEMIRERPAHPFIKALAEAGLGQESDIRAYYESVAGQPDFDLHYFYSQPDRLSRAIMPENTNPGLGRVELVIEALEQLRSQVHFNLPSDPLLATG